MVFSGIKMTTQSQFLTEFQTSNSQKSKFKNILNKTKMYHMVDIIKINTIDKNH